MLGDLDVVYLQPVFLSLLPCKAIIHIMSYPRTKSLSPPRRRLLPRHSTHTLKAFLITLTLALLTFLHYKHDIPYTLALPQLPHHYHHQDQNPGLPAEANANESSSAPPRIALITFTTTPTSYTHLSLSNKAHYANLHNYTLLVDYEIPNTNDDIMWHKFSMLSSAIASERYDWIWWLDFDTLITNMSTPLSNIISTALTTGTNNTMEQNKVDWLLTPDCHSLNAGSFLVRAHPRSLEFVDLVRQAYLRNAQSEQDCMRDVLFPANDAPSAYAGRFAMMPQKSVNAFPEEIECWEKNAEGMEVGKWERGDFVVHFAGAWAWVKEKDATGVLMQKYRGMVVWEDEEVEVDEEEEGEGWGHWDVEVEIARGNEEDGKMVENIWRGSGVSVSVSV